MSIRIRQARLTDARAIAEAHVAGWRQGYRGLLPEDYLSALSVDASERRQLQILANDEFSLHYDRMTDQRSGSGL